MHNVWDTLPYIFKSDSKFNNAFPRWWKMLIYIKPKARHTQDFSMVCARMTYAVEINAAQGRDISLTVYILIHWFIA
jgi:hypothetical protein